MLFKKYTKHKNWFVVTELEELNAEIGDNESVNNSIEGIENIGTTKQENAERQTGEPIRGN